MFDNIYLVLVALWGWCPKPFGSLCMWVTGAVVGIGFIDLCLKTFKYFRGFFI